MLGRVLGQGKKTASVEACAGRRLDAMIATTKSLKER